MAARKKRSTRPSRRPSRAPTSSTWSIASTARELSADAAMRRLPAPRHRLCNPARARPGAKGRLSDRRHRLRPDRSVAAAAVRLRQAPGRADVYGVRAPAHVGPAPRAADRQAVNGEHPHSILLFVLCVGSRDERFYKHCSRFCCMYSVKGSVPGHRPRCRRCHRPLHGHARLHYRVSTRSTTARAMRRALHARAPGRHRARKRQDPRRYENTDEGRVQTAEVTFMVVLATAAETAGSVERLAGVLGIGIAADGFVQAREDRGDLPHSPRDGPAAGCATGLKDIPTACPGRRRHAQALDHLDRRDVAAGRGQRAPGRQPARSASASTSATAAATSPARSISRHRR